MLAASHARAAKPLCWGRSFHPSPAPGRTRKGGRLSEAESEEGGGTGLLLVGDAESFPMSSIPWDMGHVKAEKSLTGPLLGRIRTVSRRRGGRKPVRGRTEERRSRTTRGPPRPVLISPSFSRLDPEIDMRPRRTSSGPCDHMGGIPNAEWMSSKATDRHGEKWKMDPPVVFAPSKRG